MDKFTSGKWTYDTPSGCVHCEGKLIAGVAGAGGANYQHDKGQANARLIAAAPELYALLKEELIPTSDYGGILSLSRTAKIRELLARIDGEKAERV